jgi:hypothetical protein
MGRMAIRLTVMADTRPEGEACVVMLRAMGMDVSAPTCLTHDGSWMVRARSAEGQREDRLQRQDGCECTVPNEAS